MRLGNAHLKTKSMKAIQKWLNKDVKEVSFDQNTFTPSMGINDAKRKQFFTTYNQALMDEIRRVKLNQVNK